MNKTKTPPTLTVVVTRTKDRPNLLRRAMESVQTQTTKDLLQVVVNDGGDAGPVKEIVEEYKKVNPERVALIDNKKSKGRTVALNQAIKSTHSKYIAVLDDDDTWHPDYLKKTTEHLERTEAKGVVAVIDTIVEKVVDGEIEQISRERWRPHIKTVSLYGQCIDNYAPTVAFVYKREVYDELDGYDESLNVVEDWEFTLRFLLKYDIDFLNTNEALAYYHHRPDATGAVGNTVFAGVDEHRAHLNRLANEYLRKDLKEGQIGVGYIMNSLMFEREERKLQEEALRAHINKSRDSLVENLNSLDSRQKHTEEELRQIIMNRTSIVQRFKSIFGRK